jgi:threonyl-tRNA synthetase
MQRVPYLLIIGDKELENQQVTVRTQSGEDLGSFTVNGFVDRVQQAIVFKK